MGDGFLNECSSLEEVDLSNLSNLQEVGHGFLRQCSSLKKVDLKGLRSLQKVWDCFLSECSSLEEVDLSDLLNLQELGDDFLSQCSSLTRVILPASPPECLHGAVEGFPAAVQQIHPNSKNQKSVGPYGRWEGYSSCGGIKGRYK